MRLEDDFLALKGRFVDNIIYKIREVHYFF